MNPAWIGSRAWLLLCSIGCGNVGASSAIDASVDTQSIACDPAKPFTDIRQVPGVDTADFDETPSLSPDELVLYFASNRQSPGTANGDIYVATRASRDDTFGPASPVAAVNTGDDERGPAISADGLSLFFHSSRNIGVGTSYDLFVSRRPSTAANFGAPVALGPEINTVAIETAPVPSVDGQALYFNRTANNSSSTYLWRATLGPTGFGSPVMVDELDTGDAMNATLSADGLTIYFTSNRAGGVGSGDIWVATRANTSKPFGQITDVGAINSISAELTGWISPDGCRLYFWSNRSGGSGDYDLWQATRPR